MSVNEIEIQVLKSVVTKLDQTLDKISESTNTIGRLLAVHDERINNLEKDNNDANKDIKDLYGKMENNTKEILKEISAVENRIEDKLEKASEQSCEQHQALSSKVDNLDDRMNEMERWKWYIIGALTLITFLVTNVDRIISFIRLFT